MMYIEMAVYQAFVNNNVDKYKGIAAKPYGVCVDNMGLVFNMT